MPSPKVRREEGKGIREKGLVKADSLFKGR
jgi:hypothetical protein